MKRMEKILLVEDAPDFQLLVKKTLGTDYQLTCVDRAQDALEATKRTQYDLVLLDIVLKEGDGLKLCADIQALENYRTVPVIFITGRSQISDKITGFSLGADDYIVKPFDPLEFKIRVEAKIKKYRQRKSQDAEIKRGNLLIKIPFQKAFWIDPTTLVENDLDLTPIEFKLLYYFMRREGHALSRAQLLEAVWGDDVNVLDRTIDKHIFTLRQKLGKSASAIKTLSGVGYRFLIGETHKEH